MINDHVQVNSPIGKRLLKYIVSGTISAVCAWISSVILFHFLSINFIYSQGIGFIVGLFINFPLSRRWAFRNRYAQIGRQFGIFASIASIGLGINELSLYLLAGILHWNVAVSMAVSLGVAFIWNFTLNNFVTFGLLKN